MEIADAVGLSRSTTYRLADRLHEWGFLANNPATGRWALGVEASRLGLAALQKSDVTRVAPTLLRLLVQQTRETVGLAVFHSDRMVFVYRQLGPMAVAAHATAGAQRPLHCTAVGKAYLAELPEPRRHTLLGRLSMTAYTPATITSRAVMEQELTRIRNRGWAEERGELTETRTCCGAAVLDHTGSPVGAIAASGHTSRVAPELDRLGPLVASTAQAISRQLGYTPQTS